MKTIEITLYNIDELKTINNKAYEKILNDTREYLINTNFEYADYDVIEILKDRYNLDIKKDNICYSISYCQGDGFCFIDDNILSYTNIKNKSDNCNIFEKWIIDNLKDDELTLLLDYLNCNYNLSIKKISHNYCHAHTCKIDYEYFYSSDDNKYLDRINDFIYKLTEKLFNDVYISICSDIEKILYGYYEIDDNDVIDFIKDNEYMYDVNGIMY